MNHPTGRYTSLLVTGAILLSFLLSLSCCGSAEKGVVGAPAGSAASPAAPSSKRPPQMLKALAEGKKEGRIVMVQLYDPTCIYCRNMDKVLAKKSVKDALAGLVQVRVSVEEEGIIEEFGMTESPTFLFFKPKGGFMEPMLEGYRSSRRFAAEVENFKLMAEGKEPKKLKKDHHPDFGKG